jgi:hypothetical protein
VHHGCTIWPDGGQIMGVPALDSPTSSGDVVHMAWFAARVLPNNAVSAAAYTAGRALDPA